MAEEVMTPEIGPKVPILSWSRCGHAITATIRDVKCLCEVLRHPDTPWYARMVLFLPVAYICSPIQILPNFIPVVGQLDDFFMIWLANRLLKRLVSEDIRRECREAVEQPKFNPADDKFLTRATADEV